jgi:hypothetical protein
MAPAIALSAVAAPDSLRLRHYWVAYEGLPEATSPRV